MKKISLFQCLLIALILATSFYFITQIVCYVSSISDFSSLASKYVNDSTSNYFHYSCILSESSLAYSIIVYLSVLCSLIVLTINITYKIRFTYLIILISAFIALLMFFINSLVYIFASQLIGQTIMVIKPIAICLFIVTTSAVFIYLIIKEIKRLKLEKSQRALPVQAE